MPDQVDSLLDRLMHRRMVKRWGRAASEAALVDLDVLRALRSRARQLRREVDRLLHVADGRLTLPLMTAQALRTPLGTEWAWRPEAWSGPVFPAALAAPENRAKLGAELTLFHDCATSEMTLRQERNVGAADLAPFGLVLDVLHFDGSFLSLVLDLPEEAVQGLKLRHLVRLDLGITLERPIEVFARLNVKHGPNTEQIVRELPLHEGEVMVEFDLAYTKLNEKRVERAWIDLIFEDPKYNRIALRELTIARRPRAEL